MYTTRGERTTRLTSFSLVNLYVYTRLDRVISAISFYVNPHVQKFYSLNLVTKVCTIGGLREPFPVVGIPPGANATGEFFIGVTGIANNYVLIDRYEDFNGRRPLFYVHTHYTPASLVFSGMYVGMWTRLGCAPVATFINSTRYGNVFYE